jgi:hypothetical protein
VRFVIKHCPSEFHSCISEAGVMIWAVDQDNFAGDALAGVLGEQQSKWTVVMILTID